MTDQTEPSQTKPRQTKPGQTKPGRTAADPAEDKTATAAPDAAEATEGKGPEQKPGEIGGPKGPEPTRYGDWEFKGRCSDF